MVSFGRAYRMLEAWIEADLTESVMKLMASVFSGSPELRLLEVLARAQEALDFSEIAVRCSVSRNELLRAGRVRLALVRMETSGIVLNVGTKQRPRLQLNLSSKEAKVLLSIFAPTYQPTLIQPYGSFSRARAR